MEIKKSKSRKNPVRMVKKETRDTNRSQGDPKNVTPAKDTRTTSQGGPKDVEPARRRSLDFSDLLESRKDKPVRERFDSFLDELSKSFGDIIGGPKPESQMAEEKDEDATVALFDGFESPREGSTSTHGDLTEQALMEAGFSDEDIQRFNIGGDASLGEFKDALADGEEGALNDFVEDRITGLLDSTSDGIEEILNDKDSKITTINQSQSGAEGRVVGNLWEEAKKDPEFRDDLIQHLGLPEGASEKELAQALVDEVGSIVDSSDDIKKSKKRYDAVSERASEAGITHVVTSGNLGRLADELSSMGVEVDQRFYDSTLANQHTTVVGAVDSNGQAAVYNSPHAGAEISANGDIKDPGAQTPEAATASGTSFAAPRVAAAAAILAARYPELSPQEIEDLLVSSADPVKGLPMDIGAGTLDVKEALQLAA